MKHFLIASALTLAASPLLAADLATAKARFDPTWPNWRKVEFWADLDPKIESYKARAKELTGSYVCL